MNNTVPDIPSSLFTTFNDVTYYDEPHKYYVNGKQLTSVTTLIHKYQNEFDEEFFSEKIANRDGVPQDEVKYAWRFINRRATEKGSAIHDYAEMLFLNKVFPYPKDKIVKIFGQDVVKEEYEKTKKHIDVFYNVAKDRLIPIRTEFVVYDIEYLIGGMVDLLFYNKKSGMFEIWDWKTNKNFTYVSERGENMLGKLSLLEDCNLEIYSLQLSTYKYIIEKYCNIKLGQSYLVWVSHLNDSYEIVETKDREYYVKQMLEDHKFQSLLSL